MFNFFNKKIILHDACDKYAGFKPSRNIKGFTVQCLTDPINPFHTEIFRRGAIVGFFKAPRVFFDKGKGKVKSFEKESEILEPRRTKNAKTQKAAWCGGRLGAGLWGVGVGHEAGRRVL